MNTTRRGFFASLFAGVSAAIWYQPRSIGIYDIAERFYSKIALEALVRKTPFHQAAFPITVYTGKPIVWFRDQL